MAFAQNDWQYTGDTESVTLNSRTSGDNFTAYSGVISLRKELKITQRSGDVISPPVMVGFVFWKTQMALVSAPAPQEGDNLTDASGVVYTVIDVTYEAVTGTYDITSQQQLP